VAQSTQTYQLDGAGVNHPFTVEQRIFFEECAGTVPAANTMRLRIFRSYIGYDDKESIIRYGMTSKVTPLGVEEDPCREAKCGPYSTCVVTGESHNCVCHPGYVNTRNNKIKGSLHRFANITIVGGCAVVFW